MNRYPYYKVTESLFVCLSVFTEGGPVWLSFTQQLFKGSGKVYYYLRESTTPKRNQPLTPLPPQMPLGAYPLVFNNITRASKNRFRIFCLVPTLLLNTLLMRLARSLQKITLILKSYPFSMYLRKRSRHISTNKDLKTKFTFKQFSAFLIKTTLEISQDELF